VTYVQDPGARHTGGATEIFEGPSPRAVHGVVASAAPDPRSRTTSLVAAAPYRSWAERQLTRAQRWCTRSLTLAPESGVARLFGWCRFDRDRGGHHPVRRAAPPTRSLV